MFLLIEVPHILWLNELILRVSGPHDRVITDGDVTAVQLFSRDAYLVRFVDLIVVITVAVKSVISTV